MKFPIEVALHVPTDDGTMERKIILHGGLTVLLGPNGSGKTQLLRGLKERISLLIGKKKVRFISAGRMGPIETFRSDFDGQRGGAINYDGATHGRKQDVQRRHLIETLNGDLQTLSERTDILIKVQERLRKLFRRDVLVDWNGGSLQIKFARLNSKMNPYSSAREASGLLHLVGILSALYDDEVGALLIDEPEVSLHPQLQAFLLKEIYTCAGDPEQRKKLIVIATHSTEFVQISQPEDLCSLIFCYDLGEPPIQIDPNAGELKNNAVRGLLARLGQEHKLALFAQRPILVEGPSDVIIASGLAAKLNANIEAAGSQLLPVVGKGQLPIVAKLLRLMGKQPVALADADGFADGPALLNTYLADNSEANAAANALGAPSAMALAANAYSDFCKLVEKSWDEICEIAETHHYWINRDKTTDALLAKRRAVFGSLFSPGSDEWLDAKTSRKKWFSIRERLKAVLDLVEGAGLFFLRRGTIEGYYKEADPLTSVGKPSAAAVELAWISAADPKEVASEYADVMRCIWHAASSEEINEAEALRGILLAVAAPAQANLQRSISTQELQNLSRGLVGERSQIFELSIDGNELVINLKSKILDVPGFPIRITKSDNVGAVVASALKLKN